MKWNEIIQYRNIHFIYVLTQVHIMWQQAIKSMQPYKTKINIILSKMHNYWKLSSMNNIKM